MDEAATRAARQLAIRLAVESILERRAPASIRTAGELVASRMSSRV